jgi:hypothetical protein
LQRCPVVWGSLLRQLNHGLVVSVAAILTLLAMCAAAATRESGHDRSVDFNIQAQPLSEALARFGDITGREAFYQASLVEGRISNIVVGRFGAVEGLGRLLDGTGLHARFLDDGSFVLTLPQQGHAATTQAGQAASQRYYAQIQAAVRASFCRQQGLQPGTLRAVALVWIGSHGAIERVQQLSSSDTPAIDRAIETAFLAVKLDERPPTEFAQPALIMMIPQAAGASGCHHEIGPMRAGRP